jgi:hypothetical protein
LPGKPWDGQGDTAKVWKGLADIVAELEKHPFPKAGSVSRVPRRPTVRLCYGQRQVRLSRPLRTIRDSGGILCGLG